MNLYDIVARKDRSVSVADGTAEAVRYPKPENVYGVVLSPGATLTLRDAHEFFCLATFPRDLGWWFTPLPGSEPKMRVELSIHAQEDDRTERLFDYAGKAQELNPLLTWPSWAGAVSGFDLSVRNAARTAVRVVSGPVFDPRAALRDLLRGTGVEVGPGANPFVRPSCRTDVRYVETMAADEWLRTYDKTREPTPDERALWDRYVIGDAQQIDCCADGSLDFVFSNHVFEHLMNPLGVLANWSRKLKPGGAIVGVVPDCRYCFDLRQPPSTPAEWLAEREDGAWALTRAKFEKWCRFTAPYNTVDGLIARNYSVHAHYYTPLSFRELVTRAIADGYLGRAFYNTSPNNKDFGFALWK